MGRCQAGRCTVARGQCDLVRRKDGKWFLLVTVDRPNGTKTPPTDVPGVGLGVGNIVTDSDGQPHFGAHIEECRLRHHNLRRSLQTSAIGGDDVCRLAAGLAMYRWLGEVMGGANGEWRAVQKRVASGSSRLATHYSLLASTGSSRNCPYYSPSPAGRCARPCAGPGRTQAMGPLPRPAISRRRCGLTSGDCAKVKPPSPPGRCLRRRMPLRRTGQRPVASRSGCRKPTRGRVRPASPAGRAVQNPPRCPLEGRAAGAPHQ